MPDGITHPDVFHGTPADLTDVQFEVMAKMRGYSITKNGTSPENPSQIQSIAQSAKDGKACNVELYRDELVNRARRLGFDLTLFGDKFVANGFGTFRPEGNLYSFTGVPFSQMTLDSLRGIVPGVSLLSAIPTELSRATNNPDKSFVQDRVVVEHDWFSGAAGRGNNFAPTHITMTLNKEEWKNLLKILEGNPDQLIRLYETIFGRDELIKIPPPNAKGQNSVALLDITLPSHPLYPMVQEYHQAKLAGEFGNPNNDLVPKAVLLAPKIPLIIPPDLNWRI